jgi:hypothetical protein
VIQRIAMNEQQWWTGAAVTQPNDGPAGAHIEVLKPREFRCHVG